MERAVEGLLAVCFFSVGLSHALQPLAWVEFFVWLRGIGRCGVFLEGLLTLNCGALVVAFHNVWTGLPVVVTVLGWATVLKATVRLAAPGQVKTPAAAERLFAALAEGGAVTMPIGETFWAVRFGMLVDKFDVPWMVNCE